MNIQEIKRLRKQELCGALRCSNFFEEASLKDNADLRQYLYSLNVWICNLTSNANKELTDTLLKILKQPNAPFQIVEGEQGTIADPYFFHFTLGKGLKGGFLKADSLFDLDDAIKDRYRDLYKNAIQPNQCFNNCVNMALGIMDLPYGQRCQVLSGILSNDNNFGNANVLHSLLLVQANLRDLGQVSFVIDFNHNLCMNQNAYFTIFDFEPLNMVDFNTLVTNRQLIKQKMNDLSLDTLFFNFATDDYLDYLKNPMRQQTERLYDSNSIISELLSIAQMEEFRSMQDSSNPQEQ